MRQSILRPEFEATRLPFLKQLYGQIDAETDRMLGFERMDKIKETVDPIKRAKREGNMKEAREMRDAAPELYALGWVLERTRDRMSDFRKRELAIISSDRSDDAKYTALMEISGKKRRALQEMNAAYNKAARLPSKKD